MTRSVKTSAFVAPQHAPSRVADQFVERLVEAGVDRVFGIPGGAISPLYDALIGSDIDVVVTQHEGMAMYLAYGYARATGQPGVVMVTSGPGVLNTTTGLAAARFDEVPMVVVAGDVKRAFGHRGTLQDGSPNGLDVLHVTRSLTKYVESVPGPGRAVASLHQALRVCQVHPQGPVLLNVAMDTAAGEVRAPRIHGSERGYQAAEGSTVREIAAHLAAATRPALYLGLGARLAGVGPDVLALAERVRCPVMTDLEAKGLFPESHTLSLGLFGVGSHGRAERYLEGGVDFLLTVGARLDDATTGGFSDLLRADTMVQLDHNAARINRAYDFDMAVVCDLAGTVSALERSVRAPTPALVLARDAALRAVREPPSEVEPTLDRAPFHPAAVIRGLQEALPDDAVFTSDIGNHLVFAAQHLRLDVPGRFHVSQGLGGMGSGVGQAMGLALGLRGSTTVVGICGDGSLRMVGNELATCAAHDIPVILAVLDDGHLGMVEHGNQRVFGRSGYCESPSVDVVSFARALGARAVRIDRSRDLVRALEERGKGPLVLHIPVRAEVQASNPRADAFAFPDGESA